MDEYRYQIDGIGDTVREALKDARHQIITRETLYFILIDAAQRVIKRRPPPTMSLFTEDHDAN